MSYVVALEMPAAIRVAELLEQDGNLDAAAQVWWQLCGIDPYDRRTREKVGDLAYAIHGPTLPPPGVERSRVLLRLVSLSFPTARLSSAYFDSLEHALAARPKRAQPGALVVGLGSGRCGTTTLADMVAQAPDACATHENPPLVFLPPHAEQLEFHRRRFEMLRAHFAVVCDVSSWWLNAWQWLVAEFPDVRLIGLVRETAGCVESFMKQKGSGRGSQNALAAPNNAIWRTAPADPCKPNYPVPPGAEADPDGAKRAMFTRFVTESNQALEQVAAADPARWLIVRTETMGSPQARAEISRFLGMEIGAGRALNVGTQDDGNTLEWTF